MKFAFILMLALCIAVPAFADDTEQEPGRDARGEVVSRAFVDIDEDGAAEMVEIYVASGRRYVDEEDWCGKGEKWEGEFRIRVADNRKLLRDNADPLPVGSLFAPMFELKFADYNSDGNLDFNLTEYADCNYRKVYFFTVYPAGKVERLDTDTDVRATTSENSTGVVKALSNGCFSTVYMDAERGQVTDTFCWKSSRFFLKDESVFKDEETGVSGATDNVEEQAAPPPPSETGIFTGRALENMSIQGVGSEFRGLRR